jgi:Glucose dehydrogenase
MEVSRLKSTIGICFGAAVLSLSVAHAGVTDEDILNDAMNTENVVSYGIGTKAQRYSPLSKINVETVKDLVPAWSFSFGGEKQRGQEAQPVVYNGRIFVTASYSRLFAIDAKTGQELWEYNHRLPDGILPCCDVINRGAALYGDLVIFGTLDAKIVALNQETGKVVWKKKVDDYKAGYSLTAAPIIVNGKVITGVSGGEFGVVGRVEARDALTGAMVWSRPVIEGHMGYKYGPAVKQKMESIKTAKKLRTGFQERVVQPGQEICGKRVVQPHGLGERMMQKSGYYFSEQEIRHHGMLICARVITCILLQPWRLTLKQVR